MADRRPRLLFWVPLLFGLMALTNVVTKPRFATYYKPDVVTLIGVGMLFSAALFLFIAFLRERRSR